MNGSGSLYNGESVRSTVRRLYGNLPEAALTLAHATVPPITAELIASHARVFDAVFGALREQLQAEQQQQSTAAATAAVAGSWLLSVPTSLRSCEEDVVNYLGMLVAIDFCHWAEVRRSPEHSAASPSATAAISNSAREEGGIEAAPGEEVTGFAGFYTVVVEPEASTVATDTAARSSAEQTERAEKLLTEPKASTLSTSSDAKAKDVTLLRGSAAMMWLLRRAVEVHHTPWYDVDYLLQFNGDVDAALRALRVCFMGCEADGVTPLWMPCARTRVQLLLSLADTFQQKRTSFYRLLCDCGGFMFRPPADTVAAQDGVRGFVPSLVLLHPRYSDFACLESGGVDSDPILPILKLSQLTALALEQALPPLWCSRCIGESSTSPVSTSPAAWMTQRAAAIAEALASPSSPSSAVNFPSSALTGLFTDRAELSICCDYQIPKTLRAAGLITYDAHLAQVVDQHILLRPGCVEEASIRVAALVAAERLLDYVNSVAGAAAMSQSSATGTALVPRPCTVNHLDYALWFVGRYMVSSEARHHLCRTLMY